jgi:uncharacterized damage-inducible protein DinB
MSVSEAVLQEFDQEMAGVRRTLERIPEDKLAWKPHEKSMLLGRLAGHLAELPGFGTTALTTDAFDLASRSPDRKPLVAESQKHVLAEFDKNVARVREAIAATSDEDWSKSWTLSLGGKKIYSGTRMGALRSMVMNHIIHHRAQLGVYLRLNNVPVPSIYGPSADEGLK